MISHKHETIFVHIPKAAGTSVERSFMEDLDLDMDNRHALLLGVNNNLDIGPRRISHLTAREYVEGHYINQELFDKYFKFAIVRDPVDRIFSSFKYLNYDAYLSFDTFVKFKLKTLLESKKYGYFFLSQYDYLYDDRGNLMVDFIGKLNSSAEDFEIIKNAIDHPQLVLKHYNKGNKNLSLINKLQIAKQMLKDLDKISKFRFSKKKKTLSNQGLAIIKEIYKKDYESFKF